MSGRRLTLVENQKRRKKRKLQKMIALLFVCAILGGGAYFVSVAFSIDQIEVKGNTTYSEAEILSRVKGKQYVNNTLVMIVMHKLTGNTYLPFIENISMSYQDPHILKIKVKESMRAGVFEYMGRNVYFDSEGIALESRNMRFESVPVVTGVKFKKLVLGEKIPVDGDYLETIVLITKKIASYQLDISRIHFEDEDDIYLVSGKYQIHIGSSQYLSGKMSRISGVLESVSQKEKKGTIDMHLYTDDKNIITFRK